MALVIGFWGGKPAAGSCRKNGPATNYRVTIQNSEPSAATVRGHLCDTLTFTNKDSVAREIAFGPHEKHVPYDGVAERVLAKNESFTVTLTKTGTYRWHDHLHDEVRGDFTVAR